MEEIKSERINSRYPVIRNQEIYQLKPPLPSKLNEENLKYKTMDAHGLNLLANHKNN